MSLLDKLNWNDVRVFLIAMRATSLRDVAEQLNISHATAGRRLTALEAQLGLTLFDRRANGLHPRAEALKIAQAAQDVERAMLALGRAAQAADPELRGTVRVTMPLAFANHLLMPDLARFSRRWPELDLHLLPSSALSALERAEADVAVRLKPVGVQPAEHLVGRKAATAYRAIYGLNQEAWVGWAQAPRNVGETEEGPRAKLPRVGNFPDVTLQFAACKAGLGMAWLPCFMADGHLPRLCEPVPAMDIWVVVHPDLRRSVRLRAFRDAIVASLKDHNDRLKGVSPSPSTDS